MENIFLAIGIDSVTGWTITVGLLTGIVFLFRFLKNRFGTAAQVAETVAMSAQAKAELELQEALIEKSKQLKDKQNETITSNNDANTASK